MPSNSYLPWGCFQYLKDRPPYPPVPVSQHPFHCTISSRTRGRWSGAEFSRNLLASSGRSFGQVHERSQIRRRLQPALLTPSEKDELDEWYVRHASLLLDLRIIMMTLRVLICGQSRPDCAAASARGMRNLSRESSLPDAQPAIKAKMDRTGERAGAAAAL